jgi:hypothetical protein
MFSARTQNVGEHWLITSPSLRWKVVWANLRVAVLTLQEGYAQYILGTCHPYGALEATKKK